jgi:AcrR family transcriptional regulator
MSRSREEVLEEFRVQSILEAAVRVIARRGVSEATMQDVADEARIAKGTIYLYFKSREDLVQRTADLVVSQLAARLAEALEAPGNARAGLGRLVRTKIDFFDANREFLRAYLAACQSDGGPEPKHRHPTYELHLRRLAGFLGEAMKRHELRRCDPDRLALLVTEGVNAVIRRRLNEAAPPAPEDEVEWITATLFEGVSPERRLS